MRLVPGCNARPAIPFLSYLLTANALQYGVNAVALYQLRQVRDNRLTASVVEVGCEAVPFISGQPLGQAGVRWPRACTATAYGCTARLYGSTTTACTSCGT